ncbi:MAG: tetratricopeptide repeat protein [Acidobacteriota bacterium]
MKATALPVALFALLAVSAPSFAAPTVQETSPAPTASLEQRSLDGAVAFATAKMLVDEGAFRDALESFEEAVRLEPRDPYIRSEYAEFLTRLAKLSRSPHYRQEQIALAVEQAKAARRLAPRDADVLRIVGATFLAQAEVQPQDRSGLDSARVVFEDLRRLYPDDSQAHTTLGQIYLFQGELERAIKVLNEAISNNPGDRQAASILVEALVGEERFDEAKAVLADILRFNIYADEARLNLSDLHLQTGDRAAALEVLESGPPEFHQTSEAQRVLARAYFVNGELDSAYELVSSLLEQGAPDPDDSLARMEALVMANRGDREGAVERIERLVKRGLHNADLSGMLAQNLVILDRPEEAWQVLERAVSGLEQARLTDNAHRLRLEWAELLNDRQTPESHERALEVLGPVFEGGERQRLTAGLLAADSLLALERGEEALEMLSESAEEPAILAKRGEILLMLDRPEEARVLFDSLDVGDADVGAVAVALVYQRLERYEDTVTWLEDHLDEHEPTTRVLFLLGAARERSGDFDGAVADFRRLLSMDDEFHEAMNYLGYMYAERGENLEEALSLAQRAVELDASSGAYVDTLGWALFQLGRYDEAQEQLEKAAELLPEDPTIHEHLGDLYLAQGRFDSARESYARALEIEGVDAEALGRKLEELDRRAEAP